jgi:hypothetical protein
MTEPSTYEDAVTDENWSSAIKYELSALIKNNTWDLTALPSHKKAIGCKWVLKLKLHANGTVERYSARLVAKGFTQYEGIDYMDTFNPVVKMTTIRIFIAISASQNWLLFQLDINIAFLYGDLNEKVYMKPHSGLELPHPNLVCKLQTSLYGSIKPIDNGIPSSLKHCLLQDILNPNMITLCLLRKIAMASLLF